MAGTVWRIRQSPHRIGIGLVLATACLVSGCLSELPDSASGINGWTDYEDRLDATAGEFAYRSLLDDNLAPQVWESKGLSLRVPLPFHSVVSADQNSRQGHALSREVLGEPLPGVLGSWQAVLPGKEGHSPQAAYMFAMSNHHLWSHSKTSAMAFHQTLVEDVLAELSGLSRLPIASDWKTENHSGHGQPYAVATFEAELAQSKTPADCTLFLFQHGTNQRRDEIKAALLFIIPKNAVLNGSRSDVDPKTLSAETVHITPRPMDSP